jgi:hypothetical protein
MKIKAAVFIKNLSFVVYHYGQENEKIFFSVAWIALVFQRTANS